MKKPHRFKKLEILGENVKRLRNPQDFFFRLFQRACANIEEIIIDGILKRNQLGDMVRGLYAVLQPPKGDASEINRQIMARNMQARMTPQQMRLVARHRLEKVTFIKPQEFSEEIQMLEHLLDQKLAIMATYDQRKHHHL